MHDSRVKHAAIIDERARERGQKVASKDLIREESDMDLRTPLAAKLEEKRLMVEWIKGHRREAGARSQEEKIDIR